MGRHLSLSGIIIGVVLMAGCSSDDDHQSEQNGTPDFAVLNDPSSDYHPTVSPTVVYEGSLVVVRIPVSNVGETSTSALEIDTQVTSDAPEVQVGGDVPFQGVEIGTVITPAAVYQAGAIWWYESQFEVGAAGTYQFTFTLDPHNHIFEWSKANNAVTVTFSVNPFPALAQ